MPLRTPGTVDRSLVRLQERLGELADLRSVAKLVEWDQRTMMPRQGAPARAHHLATLHRITHELAGDDELGELIDEAIGNTTDERASELVRLARRDWSRARRVPGGLAGEIAAAGADGLARWHDAREANDFRVFVPALERNLELARAFAERYADEVDEPYDALLANFDHGVTSAWLRPIFADLKDRLPPLVARRSDLAAVGFAPIPSPVLREAAADLLRRVGMDGRSWRLDEAAHPFSSSISRRDTRLAVRYSSGDAQALLLALHEFGHGLYERQIAPELQRTPAGRGTSMSVHESQSKLWEDQIGRHPAFAPVLAAALRSAGYEVEPDVLHQVITAVRPSTNRIGADAVTYPLHVVLRFELETELLSGALSPVDVPVAWREGMHRLLGVDVHDDNDGPLQDDHWSDGAFGYFPSYAIGSLIAAQLWSALERDLGSQVEPLSRADVGAIRLWLEEHVHRRGRLADTRELVCAATGRDLRADDFLSQAAAA